MKILRDHRVFQWESQVWKKFKGRFLNVFWREMDDDCYLDEIEQIKSFVIKIEPIKSQNYQKRNFMKLTKNSVILFEDSLNLNLFLIFILRLLRYLEDVFMKLRKKYHFFFVQFIKKMFSFVRKLLVLYVWEEQFCLICDKYGQTYFLKKWFFFISEFLLKIDFGQFLFTLKCLIKMHFVLSKFMIEIKI